MDILIDGRRMVSREAVHDVLAEKLHFPAYYGRNLDALYDLLSEYPEPLDITLVHADVMVENLGNYANALLRTLRDASVAFPNVKLSVSNEII